MRRQPSRDTEQLRRRKRQQRRVSRGAPHPKHYTECNPVNQTQEQPWPSVK